MSAEASTTRTGSVIDMSAERPERRERQTALAVPDANPMQMLAVAVQQGADIAKLEKLMELQQRWEQAQARKAYVAAMALFKAEPSRIVKTKQVNIPGGAKFAHATLADVCDGIVANLSKYGLSHGWETKQTDNGWVEVSCIITHESGHSERTTLKAPPDDSGKKNTIQQIASTVTYLERYTLMAACGLAAKDMDNDGRGADDCAKISEQQIANLQALLTEVGANEANFLKYLKVATLADIPAAKYQWCVKDIEARR